MEYRLLGKSGLKVSALSMGTMTLGSNKAGPIGSVGLKEGKRLIDMCVDAGVNLIDTANVYTRGSSEEIIGAGDQGQARQARDRHQGALQHARPAEHRRQFAHQPDRRMRAQPEAAQTDWIDLYQVHQWDGETPVEETMEALDSLVKAGRSATSAARISPAGTS